jgi:hypothetical protein
VVEQYPKLEGRQMVMVLAPKKKALPVKAKKPAAAATGAPAKKDAAAPAKKEAAKPATA